MNKSDADVSELRRKRRTSFPGPADRTHTHRCQHHHHHLHPPHHHHHHHHHQNDNCCVFFNIIQLMLENWYWCSQLNRPLKLVWPLKVGLNWECDFVGLLRCVCHRGLRDGVHSISESGGWHPLWAPAGTCQRDSISYNFNWAYSGWTDGLNNSDAEVPRCEHGPQRVRRANLTLFSPAASSSSPCRRGRVCFRLDMISSNLAATTSSLHPRWSCPPQRPRPRVQLWRSYDRGVPAARIGAYEPGVPGGQLWIWWLALLPLCPPCLFPLRGLQRTAVPFGLRTTPPGPAARAAPPLIARQVWGAHWSHIIASIHNRVGGRSCTACHMTAGGSCAVLRRWMRSVLVWSTHHPPNPSTASTIFCHQPTTLTPPDAT